MKTGRIKSRFGWIFLIVVLAFSLAWQSASIAENEDDIYALEEESDSSEPLPDEAPVGASKNAAPPSEETEEPFADDDFVDEGEEGDVETEEVTEIPPLSADPVELSAEVSGIARSGKHSEVIKKLEPHEDAVSESKDLLEFYVAALMDAKKPDWRKIGRFAAQLSRKDKNSSLGNYAQGMNALNAKKPDLSKAIAFFGKAKSAKKPHPDAAMAYYTAMVKKFWIIGLAVLALPIIVIINKKRKKKAAAQIEIDLGFNDASQGSPELAAEKLADAGPASESIDSSTSLDMPSEAVDEKSDKKTVKKVKKIIRRKVPVKKQEGEDQPEEIDTGEEEPQDSVEPEPGTEVPASGFSQPVQEADTVSAPPAAESDDAEELDSPVAELAPEPDPEPAVAVSQPYRPSFGESQQHESEKSSSLSSQNSAADLHRVKEISKVEKPAAVSVDAELESVWNRLSQRAIQGKISPHSRVAGSSGSSVYYDTGTYSPAFNDEAAGSPDTDVSIDLSEESLRSDLVGKLKMMAISDSELRELFAQKDPRHIPHLIEYVLTRPETVRLAFVTRELGNYGDPAVIDMLASLLYNEDHRVALAAIQGLEKTQKAAAVLHICPFLKCDIPLLAQAARSSLSNFGAVKILQAFRDLPGHPDEKIRDAGVFVLSRMRGRGVEELLLRMLSDESLQIRSNVILAMSYQKNPVYIDTLREFFRNASEADKTLARKAIVYLQGFVSARK